ncbi:MAG: hypothetical protein U1D30_15880 [Planctomycetota bacterium]
MQARSDEQRLYRLAMRLTIAMAVGSVVMTILNYFFHFLSGRAAGAMAFGMFFWLVIFHGYRSDMKQREKEFAEAKSSEHSARRSTP